MCGELFKYCKHHICLFYRLIEDDSSPEQLVIEYVEKYKYRDKLFHETSRACNV